MVSSALKKENGDSMKVTPNAKLTGYARNLRKEMTKEERHLWYDFLRNLPERVHRQRPMGPYIVDFYIASAQIIIELDGGQHYEASGISSDRRRDPYFADNGLLILRYSDADIWRNFRGVCEDILRKMEERKIFPWSKKNHPWPLRATPS